MIRPNPRMRRFSIATLILILAAGPAGAEPPPPAAPPVHKHIAGVKYEDVAKSGGVATPDNNLSPAADDAQVLEVQSIRWAKLEGAGPVYSADPMEGGQVAAARTRPGRPTYGNIAVTRPTDNAAPVARVAATFVTLAGKCVTGKHLDKVKIVTRSRSYTLHDATVTSVTPTGDGMEEVSLTYASVGD